MKKSYISMLATFIGGTLLLMLGAGMLWQQKKLDAQSSGGPLFSTQSVEDDEQQQADEAYSALQDSEDIAVLEAFLAEYPESKYITALKEKIDLLVAQQDTAGQPDKVDEAYAIIQDSEDIAVLDSFLQAYPESRYTTSIKEKIIQLQEQGEDAQKENKTDQESEKDKQDKEDEKDEDAVEQTLCDELNTSVSLDQLEMYIQIYGMKGLCYDRVKQQIEAIEKITNRPKCGPKDGETIILQPDDDPISPSTSGLCTSTVMVNDFKQKSTNVYTRVCKKGDEVSEICSLEVEQGVTPVPDLPDDPPQNMCGEKSGETYYSFDPTKGLVQPVDPGLCPAGYSVRNFFFNDAVHQREWTCAKDDAESSICSIKNTFCGDNIVNGEEACDGNDEVCGEYGSCTPLCLCLQEVVPGVCHPKRKDALIYGRGDGGGLRSSDNLLCLQGEVKNFSFDEDTHARGWTCEGYGGGDAETCQAQEEWCGDGTTNGNEQCDDGNNAGGDGCSASCKAESYGSKDPVKESGCGNAELDQGEQCDDGNLVEGDGCDDKCAIESGWKCTATAPSQCGTLECFKHGESFTQNNIYGQCCGGLSALPYQHTSSKIIENGIDVTICYDPSIDEPYCLPTASTPGRYMKKTRGAEKKSLIEKDVCVDVYKDYYQIITDLLNKQYSYCQYRDEPYDRVNFVDIRSTRYKNAIQTLVDHCIVKGPGESMYRFIPHQKINRAEFIKMLIKSMFIGKEYLVQPEGTSYQGDAYFQDIAADFWGAQYIAKAYELGLLDIWAQQYGDVDFKPYASLTTKELISILLQVDQGQALGPEVIDELLLGKKHPTREDVALVLIKRFPTLFRDYLSLQGKNPLYLQALRGKLMGKHFSEQYKIIVRQLDVLEQKNEHHAAQAYDIDTAGLADYLQDIAH